MKIILASASPRRKELLEQIGLTFQVIVSQVEEKVTTDIPCQVVEQLSEQKAEAVLSQLQKAETESLKQEEVLVIGADTIVAAEKEILGKPKDEAEAVKMLQQLQGKTHQVYTGVTLLHRDRMGKLEKKVFSEATRVTFYPMSQEEILTYTATGDPLDKAGAYGIQGFCARYIQGIEGDYNNVVGLPVGRLYQEGKEWLGHE